MSKASNNELGELHGAIARGLTQVIRDGVPTEDGPVPAPAAYFMAGITMLKNNSITSDIVKDSELAGLSEALAAKRKARKVGMAGMEDAVRDAGEELDRMLGVGSLQ